MTKFEGRLWMKLSELTGFVIDGIEPSGSVSRELYRELYNGAVSGEDEWCMQLAQGRV